MPVGFNRVEDNWPESFKGYFKNDSTQRVYTFLERDEKIFIINDDSEIDCEVESTNIVRGIPPVFSISEYDKRIAIASRNFEVLQASKVVYDSGAVLIDLWINNPQYDTDGDLRFPKILISQKQLDNYIRWGVLKPTPNVYECKGYNQYIYGRG